MTNELSCTWEEYKQMAADFHTLAKTATLEELDRGMACISIGYLNLECDPMWKSSAVLVLEMAQKTFANREYELIQPKQQGQYQ